MRIGCKIGTQVVWIKYVQKYDCFIRKYIKRLIKIRDTCKTIYSIICFLSYVNIHFLYNTQFFMYYSSHRTYSYIIILLLYITFKYIYVFHIFVKYKRMLLFFFFQKYTHGNFIRIIYEICWLRVQVLEFHTYIWNLLTTAASSHIYLCISEFWIALKSRTLSNLKFWKQR